MKNSIQRLGNITIVGLKAISRNKLRSFLTMLGIVIGVGCVIAVVAIGNGATKSVENTINSLGTNYIMLFPGAVTQSGATVINTGTLTAAPRTRSPWATPTRSATLRRSPRLAASR